MEDKERERYERARASVAAIKEFYTHATAFVLIHATGYVLVNVALFTVNVLVGSGGCFYWPLIGWGIGLGVHALAVFGFDGRPWGQDWEERKIREIMERERGL